MAKPLGSSHVPRGQVWITVFCLCIDLTDGIFVFQVDRISAEKRMCPLLNRWRAVEVVGEDTIRYAKFHRTDVAGRTFWTRDTTLIQTVDRRSTACGRVAMIDPRNCLEPGSIVLVEPPLSRSGPSFGSASRLPPRSVPRLLSHALLPPEP